MFKILAIFGTRPEAIKFAPLLKLIKNKYNKVRLRIIITGQHDELLIDVLNSFSIIPDYNLRIMKDNQGLFEIAESLFLRLEKIFKKEKPSLVLVQGDTSTAFISCLASFYFKIPVAHIEAGLRTYDKYHPFPEEMHRRLIDVLSDIHFVPSYLAKNNLIKEGIPKGNIFMVGNTVIDALLEILPRLEKKPRAEIFKNINFRKKILVVTIHRRENFGFPLENICKAIRSLAQSEKDIEIVWPVHPNPNVKSKVYSMLNNFKNVHLIKPLRYLDFIYLIKNSYLILTDSGGLQEEAPYLKKPVLVLRKKTDRPETSRAGVSRVIGINTDKIYRSTLDLLKNKAKYKKMIKNIQPYGKGNASLKIIKIILKLRNNYK
jgi:UDP-N-acetylglucosamine 2-epimerase (non-hydrolysing)